MSYLQTSLYGIYDLRTVDTATSAGCSQLCHVKVEKHSQIVLLSLKLFTIYLQRCCVTAMGYYMYHCILWSNGVYISYYFVVIAITAPSVDFT